MTLKDWARVFLRAADLAEADLADPTRDVGVLGGPRVYPEEWAAYRQLRWLADAANELADERMTPAAPRTERSRGDGP